MMNNVFEFDYDGLRSDLSTAKEKITHVENVLLHLKGGVSVGRWRLLQSKQKLCVVLQPGQLHTFRKEMKEMLGAWSDKLQGITNLYADVLWATYTPNHWPIEVAVEEDAKTIDLTDYGLTHCNLLQGEPVFDIKDKWTVVCEKGEETENG